ncbi:MAG: membrane dipeptidase [Planctomycetes bacterium]|nr:membrane dipeptidase [Planctomycetota bacterium]
MQHEEYWQHEKEVLALHYGVTGVLSYVNPSLEWSPDGHVTADMLVHGGFMTQGSVPRMRRGGVDVVVLSVGPPTGPNWQPIFSGREKVEVVLRQLELLNRLPELTGGRAEVVTTMARAEEVVARHGLAILLHLTGAFHLNDLAILRDYHDRGVRLVHPPFDDFEGRPRSDRDGLTAEARATVIEMERLGMLVDVSHVTDAMLPGIFECTQGPVVATHSNARSLVNTWRNLTDEQIERIASRGGVIGMHCGFLGEEPEHPALPLLRNLRKEKELQLWRECEGKPYSYIARRWTQRHWRHLEMEFWLEHGPRPCRPFHWMIDHLDHMVKLAGPDCLGIGTDYDMDDPPVGLEEPDKFPSITRELLRRGYSPDQVRKIIGENWVRVFRQVLVAA